MASVRQSVFTRPEDASAYLTAIFETATDSIITINEQGIVETMNPAAEKLFGYREEEMLGQNINVLMPSPHRENHDNYLKNYMHSGVKKIIGIGQRSKRNAKERGSIPGSTGCE